MNKLIHQLIVLGMSLIIFLKMMAMPISLMNYSLNRQFIAENFCENRAKTALHCGGQCFLEKKLAQSGDSHDAQNQKSSVRTVVVDFFEPFEKSSFTVSVMHIVHASSFIAAHQSGKYLSGILRPPIA